VNLSRMPVQTTPLAEARIADNALMWALLLMHSRDMLTEVQLKMKPKTASWARIGTRTLMHSAAMLEDSSTLSKGLTTPITGEIPPLEMNSPEMPVFRADVAEGGRALLALEGLELLVDGPDVQAEVTVTGKGGAADGAGMWAKAGLGECWTRRQRELQRSIGEVGDRGGHVGEVRDLQGRRR